jgi:hypothetical protein
LHEAFEEWERANRSLTRLVLQGAHRVPLAARSAAYLTGLFGNPLASLAGGLLEGASLLEAGIRRLAKHYERHGKLTPETRKHFEELMAALARQADRRG